MAGSHSSPGLSLVELLLSTAPSFTLCVCLNVCVLCVKLFPTHGAKPSRGESVPHPVYRTTILYPWKHLHCNLCNISVGNLQKPFFCPHLFFSFLHFPPQFLIFSLLLFSSYLPSSFGQYSYLFQRGLFIFSM